ncbi:MAG: ATP-dependent DNA helicase RecG [Prevotella sp.]|nr:ATP-dependent DNA helicase RecG [Prevotella sp.]
MSDILKQDIMYLPGVGPNRKKLLSAELGIETFGDLLEYYPYKYVDRTKIYAIRELTGDMPFVQVMGHILSFETFDMGPRKERVVAHFTDGTGIIDLVWFNGGKYAKQNYKLGKDYLLFGKPSIYNNRIQVQHPELEEPIQPTPYPSPREGSLDSSFAKNTTSEGNQTPLPWGVAGGGSLGLRPYYNTTERMKKGGMTSRSIERMTKTLMEKLKDPLPETLTAEILATRHLMGRDEAMRTLHYPQDTKALERARVRMKFEELFFVQLNIVRYASDHRRKYRGFVFNRIGTIFNTFFMQNLPFELTGAQKRVMHEIRKDLCSGRQMNRLLQGDVGSGKTLVALMSMLIALDNGFQACIMAPTEILAEQHLTTIREFLRNMPVRVELLTGIVKGKKRQEVLNGLLDGTVQILVGTHAVIEDTVQFLHLGLVVIDEQHRFGVAQRAKLWAKASPAEVPQLAPTGGAATSEQGLPLHGEDGGRSQSREVGVGCLPHVLVMTATPIPRTLAMTLYGDLDVSVIDELPPGRKPIRTTHIFDNHMGALYEGIRRQVHAGRQVYIVFPLIEESEKMDLKDLEQGFEVLRQVFAEFRLSKVHGRMKSSEKEEEMRRFVNGETQILVATTVIEVGVNVPNASVMVILDAQRFGLSQLHQLRGRVGRGADQSFCILVTSHKLSDETRKRIDIMCETNDGFRIAEVDLKLRGPGDLEGTQQSGMAFDLKIANIATDGQLVQMARDEAQRIIDDDPECRSPRYMLLWNRLREMRKSDINWAAIS